MSAQADKIEKILNQLVGDISRLPGVTLDQGGEAQLAQLLTDAFEQVGLVALDEWEAVNAPVAASGTAARVTG
jgi:hypothetical protein